MSETDESVVAPHGRDDQGVPKAPFGYNQDGNPRKSNRGRRSGVSAPPKKTEKNVKSGSRPKARTKAQTKHQLLELVGEFTAAGARAADSAPVRARIGDRHASAVMGHMVITQAVAPDMIDGLILAAEKRPGLLAWMDRAEELTPSLVIAKGLATWAAAIVQNHMNPSPDLEQAARSMVKVRAAQYAAAIQAEAEALGVDDEMPHIPEQRAA
ncbi:hypothetical protein ACIPWE_40210 [Streptomyces sp. NPDC090073]|uniref:hypothetical protein n=1 Tax=Streptomyces sp. NPDC090073 TaxID=3365936 RepID=UPI0037F33963